MRFSLALSAADICILLVNIISVGHGPVVQKLGKTLLEELSERLEEGNEEQSGMEHILDLDAIDSDELPYAVVQLEEFSAQMQSEEIKKFLGSMVTVIRAEKISRKS
jgi:hypothetical protein